MKQKCLRVFLCGIILSMGLFIGCDQTAKDTVIDGIESGTQTIVAALIAAAFEAAFADDSSTTWNDLSAPADYYG